jgi:hypothetical protein
MSRVAASRADDVQTLREFNTEQERIIRERISRRRAERRAEMTPAECIQAREINATHHRASRTWCALRVMGAATGELGVFQEQIHHNLPPPMKKNMPLLPSC